MKFKFLPPFILLALLTLFANFSFAQVQSNVHERTFDVQHYIIHSSFDRPNRTFFGDVTIELKPLKDNFRQIELDATGMKFDFIRLEPAGTNLQYTQTGEKLFIALDKDYSPNDVISVHFKYSSKPKKGVYFVDFDAGRPAQTWTQGEAEEAHYWFPCYDFPDDKATTEQFITAPPGEIAIANGELLDTIDNADGTKTFHYKMPVVHSTYLTSFVVGKYSKVEDKYKDVPLGYYMYPGIENTARKIYGRTPDMIQVYEQLTGVNFPYNKYDQTMVANFQFGGMENITATTMADTELFFTPPENVIDLVSHELAHSWFGDLVTCKNWSNLWLNEGFATYMEAAYREKTFGRADYLRQISEDAARAMAFDSVGQSHALLRPNPPTDDSLFDTTTYQKGGAVIHTLRETVGAENFWRAINNYLNAHKFANVESADLKKAMEEASGKDLSVFFDQWVYKAGFPRLSVKQIYNPQTKRLSLNIAQTQTGANVPTVFVMPFDVEIATADGMKNETLEIKNRVQSFTIQIDGKPSKLNFDKDEKIPLKLIKLLPSATQRTTKSKK
ncbi:MAG: M1 family metallopeptidase [Pyrinomonadaceae bacterium]